MLFPDSFIFFKIEEANYITKSQGGFELFQVVFELFYELCEIQPFMILINFILSLKIKND